MSGRTMYLTGIRTKSLTDQVCIFNGNIQKGLLASCLIMSYSRLYQMATIIEFMRIQFFPLMSPPPTRKTVAFIGYTSCKIAIRLLCRRDNGNDTVKIMIQFCIIMYGQRIACSLYDLIWIRIIKREISPLLALLQSRSDGKVIKSPINFTFMKCIRNSNRAVGFNTRTPEIIRKVYIRERHLTDRPLRVLQICRHPVLCTDLQGEYHTTY